MKFLAYLNSDKADKGNPNVFSAHQVFASTVGVNPDSWKTAQVISRAPYSTVPQSRAMYAFENTGSNAGVLYLNIDGKLNWEASDGTHKVISWETP